MPQTRHRHTKPGRLIRNVAANWEIPSPPAAVNANVIEVLLLYSGAVVYVFDRLVIIDTDNPPTTWAINGGASIQAGGSNFGTSCYLIYNSPVNPDDPVVIGANDPAARTPEGGFVNGVVLAVSDR